MAETRMPDSTYLKPNSHQSKAKQEKPQVEKVVKGHTKVKSKPMGKKLAGAMIEEDMSDVKEYLVWDVLIPALKDTIVDIIKKGVDAMFYGGATTPQNVKRSGNVSKASYAGYYNRNRRRNEIPRYRNRRATFEFDDILFESRKDAEEVLSSLVDLTMQYGMASVADFYEMSGMNSEFTDNKYGWGELSEGRVVRSRDGYFIDLPKPEPID